MYIEALRLRSRAFDIAEQRGAPRPVIVGGSAVEFYTGGASLGMAALPRQVYAFA